MDKNDYLMITAIIILAVVCILLINYIGSAVADCSMYYEGVLDRVMFSCGGGVGSFPADGFVFNGSWVMG